MRILYLCQLVPYPPDAGPKVRAYYTLRYLAQRHEVTLVAFTRPDDQAEALERLRTFCAQVYTAPIRRSAWRNSRDLLSSLAAGDSFIIRRDFAAEMASKVDRLLEGGDFDAVHADQLWMAQYALRAKRRPATGSKLQTILDEHNACFQIFQRLAQEESNPLKQALLEREWRRLMDFEARALGQFDRVVTVTDEDRKTLQGLLERSITAGKLVPSIQSPISEDQPPHFSTIPICVDTEEIQPVRPKTGARDVLHLGTMFWQPNVEGVVWFAREVWPKVREAVPGATFTIAGKNPPGEVRELQAMSGPRSANSAREPDIRVTGYVADPQPYLEEAGVFIVPLFSGSGMRVKIVDAWRWGLPVVSTRIGAEGIRYIDGENILIAEDAEGFAEAVRRVLTDGELAQRLRSNGRRWVEEHYDWRKVYSAWDEIYGR